MGVLKGGKWLGSREIGAMEPFGWGGVGAFLNPSHIFFKISGTFPHGGHIAGNQQQCPSAPKRTLSLFKSPHYF